MKNKLQSIIKHIKTMFYNLMLCVSLKKDRNTTDNKIENDFLNSEFFKRNPDMKKMYLKQKNGNAVYGTKVTPINPSNRRLII